MAGLFTKGKKKLKEEIQQAKVQKEIKVQTDQKAIEENRRKAEKEYLAGADSDLLLQSPDFDVKYNIEMRDGSNRPMTKQLIIDSICYNIMREAPMYRRLVTTPIMFVEQSIPWHVSCNGRHTLVSEDILGKTFPDIVFLVLKEFIHVALGHKVNFAFESNIVMTEERYACLRMQKNILDNCIVLTGLLNNPLELGIKPELIEISPMLEREVHSLLDACSLSHITRAWRNELSLTYVSDILEGDTKSFSSAQSVYVRDVSYKLSPKKTTVVAKNQDINIFINRNLGDKNSSDYKPRSEKINNKRQNEEKGNKKEQNRFSENKKLPNKKNLQTNQNDRMQNLNSDKKQKQEKRFNEEKPELWPDQEDDAQENHKEKNAQGTNQEENGKEGSDRESSHSDGSDKGVEAAEFGNYTEDLREYEEFANDVVILTQDVMAELDDEDIEKFVEQMEKQGIDFLDSKAEDILEFLEEFMEKPENKPIADTVPDDLKEKLDDLCEEQAERTRREENAEQGQGQEGMDGSSSSETEDTKSEYGDSEGEESGRGSGQDGQNSDGSEDKGNKSSESASDKGSSGRLDWETDEVEDRLKDAGVRTEDINEDSAQDSQSGSGRRNNENSSGREVSGSQETETSQELEEEEDLGSRDWMSRGTSKKDFECNKDGVPGSGGRETNEIQELQEYIDELGEKDQQEYNIPDFDVPDVIREDLETGDRDIEINDVDIESMRESMEQYFSKTQENTQYEENITVQTDEYDFTNQTDFKNFLKDSMNFYEHFGAEQAMSTGEYDTLRNELITSAKQNHSEAGGFSERLVKDEYSELFDTSRRWYEIAKKLIEAYAPNMHTSYQRPNKKYLAHNLILQGKSAKGKVNDIERMIMFIDSSGSMTKQDMVIFKSVLKSGSKLFPKQLLAFEFNSKVFPLKVVNGHLKEDPSKTGGTVIKTVLAKLAEMPVAQLNKTLVLVVSDGEFNWGDVKLFMSNYKQSKMIFLVTSRLNKRYAAARDELVETISKKRLHVLEVQEADFTGGIRWG